MAVLSLKAKPVPVCSQQSMCTSCDASTSQVTKFIFSIHKCSLSPRVHLRYLKIHLSCSQPSSWGFSFRCISSCSYSNEDKEATMWWNISACSAGKYLASDSLRTKKNFNHHIQRLALVLKELKRNKLHIRFEKTFLDSQKVDYLRYTLTPAGSLDWKKFFQSYVLIHLPTRNS